MLYRKGDLGRQGEVTSMVVRAEDEVLARKIADEWACSRGTNDPGLVRSSDDVDVDWFG